MTLRERAWDRQGRLESIRTRFDDQRDDVVELTRPDLYTEQDERGKFLGSDIVEGTPPWSARIMALGMQGNLVSQNIEWRRSQMEQKKFKGDDETNQWLQDMDDVMLSEYNRSNYYDVLPKYILDGVTVGSPVMLSEVDDDDKVVYVVPHYTENFLWRDQFGNDLGYHRKYQMTALQAMQRFGREKLSRVIRTALDNGNHYAEYWFLQVIYSRRDPILEGLEGERIPNSEWVQFYFEQKIEDAEKGKSLKTSPYQSKPFAAWHYWRNPFETYARTPGWFAIHDIKGGQQAWETMYVAAEMNVRSPQWIPDEMRAAFSMLPGAKNYAAANVFQSVPQSLASHVNYPTGMDFADRVNRSVERWFMVDLFRMLNKLSLGPERKAPPTAFQIQQMIGENAVLLGPGVQSFVNGLLKTQDERMLEIQSRPRFNDFGEFEEFGSIPTPPDRVLNESDGKIDTEFVGPLAIAQKQFLVGRQIQDNLAGIGPLIELNPDWLNKIKGPELIEFMLEQGRFPQHLIVPQDEYELRQQAIDRQRQLQQLIESGADASKIVKELSGEVSEDSVLAQLSA